MDSVIVDLHSHSRHSDGSDLPAEVARQAVAAGVTLFCLTDHDTTAGTDAVTAEVAGRLSILRAMELTCTYAGRIVHLLLYGITDGDGRVQLESAVNDLRARRATRIHEMCARLQRWDIHLDAEAILRAVGDASPGRNHVARALIDAGVCRTVPEAMNRFLGHGKPVDLPAPGLAAADGVALGRAAGARVALAHPHTVGGPAIVHDLCSQLKAVGLGGMEAWYGPYPTRVRAAWTSVADDLALVVTAGSDYHGTAIRPDIVRPGVALETGRAGRLRDWLGV